MQTRHLLIVDDSTLVTDALRILFETQGYRVSVAGSVAAAIACHTATPADVMLLDLTLPDGDGISVLSALRVHGTIPATIVLTGHDDDAIRTRCLAAGCLQVLAKPVPTQTLLAQVQSLETVHP